MARENLAQIVGLRSTVASVAISFSWGGGWLSSNDNNTPPEPEPSRTALGIPVNDNGVEQSSRPKIARWAVVLAAGTILSVAGLRYLPTAAVAPASNNNASVRSVVHHAELGGPLGSTIASGEGSYNSFDRGVAGDAHGRKIDLSQKSIGEIMRRQALGRGNADRLFAVGKYQVIPATMRAAVRQLALRADTKFGPQTQEKVFRDYLIATRRPAVRAYITGQSESRIDAQKALAEEFASVANPDTGRSNYGGVGGNAASISAAAVGDALDIERKSYRSAIASGKLPDEAWESLSAPPADHHGERA
jgi:hypothetical protein